MFYKYESDFDNDLMFWSNYLECNCPAFVTYGYRADTEEPIPVPFFVKSATAKSE